MLKIFISYATQYGLSYAKQAMVIFKGEGHEAWLWDHNKLGGSIPWEQISNALLNSDVVFYICTVGSQESTGQRFEAAYAMNGSIPIYPVRLDDAELPQVLSVFTYVDWQGGLFEDSCRSVAHDLVEIVEKLKKLESACVDQSIPTPTQPRLAYIKDLNARTARLDLQRVQDSKEEIWFSYQSATLPRQIASLSQMLNHEPSGFERIELWGRIKIEDFNDPKYSWASMFSDVGRALARGERSYLQRVLKQQIGDDPVTISRSDPQFEILNQHVSVLEEGSVNPDILLAPIELMVPFTEFYQSQLDWKSRPERLTVGKSSLKVIWSHKYAPLDCFIVFGAKAGTWTVRPDSETDRAITIALGESNLYTDEVEYGVETIARYEVTNPEAFRLVSLSD